MSGMLPSATSLSSAAAESAAAVPAHSDNQGVSSEVAAVLLHLQNPENGLIGNRRWRLKLYDNVFVGKEAVTSLVQAGITPNRTEAVEVLRMALESNLISHVAREHHFSDKYLFYKVNDISIQGDQQVPTLGSLKNDAKKIGEASVRCGKFVNDSCCIILSSDDILHIFKTLYDPYPLVSLSLKECSSGDVSFCGKLKSGKFGISITPPICELNQESNQNKIALLFDKIKDQEAWLHAFVKSGLVFKEMAYESKDASTATSIYDFLVKHIDGTSSEMRSLCEGKVTIICNVASF